MKRIFYSIHTNVNKLFTTAVCMTILASCNSILDNENVDCNIEYRVKFKYDYNMKYADAFANEVKSVTLYAFDDKGRFVYQRTEQGDILAEQDYSMPLEVKPGDYHLISWAGLEKEESFSVPVLIPEVSTIDDLTCRMNRITERTNDGMAVVSENLKPLFHGEVIKQSFSRANRIQTITMPLVKNTNSIRIILQQLSGKGLDVTKFEFTITDDNGLMNFDNSLLEDETLTYYPWYTTQGSTTVDRSVKSRTDEQELLNVAIAQLTIGRLIDTNHPKLTITNKETGKTVISIPLIDYLKLTEAEGHKITTQEYLDRQDEYSLTFFLDGNTSWVKTQIIINGWVVRYNDFSPSK